MVLLPWETISNLDCVPLMPPNPYERNFLQKEDTKLAVIATPEMAMLQEYRNLPTSPCTPSATDPLKSRLSPLLSSPLLLRFINSLLNVEHARVRGEVDGEEVRQIQGEVWKGILVGVLVKHLMGFITDIMFLKSNHV